jgi:hypothetical protein
MLTIPCVLPEIQGSVSEAIYFERGFLGFLRAIQKSFDITPQQPDAVGVQYISRVTSSELHDGRSGAGIGFSPCPSDFPC